jgi:hypothetical protein
VTERQIFALRTGHDFFALARAYSKLLASAPIPITYNPIISGRRHKGAILGQEPKVSGGKDHPMNNPSAGAISLPNPGLPGSGTDYLARVSFTAPGDASASCLRLPFQLNIAIPWSAAIRTPPWPP